MEEDGCLAIKGKSLFSGTLEKEDGKWVYHEREDDWFVTSDRVEISDAGITPLGRADLRVKVLGELVNLEQIEERLVFHSFRRIRRDQVVVVALPDARAENKLVPVFDAEVGMQVVGETLKAYRTQVYGVDRLQECVLLDDFPRSELGKPKRGLVERILGNMGA